MAPRIHERTRDRVSAVQVLYTSELTGKSPSELLDCGLCLVAREAPADEAEAAEAGAFGRIEEGTLTDYALALIHGVEASQAQVDERIEAASENWALSRMPIVDRSILRLAVFEMFNCDDVPVSVSINEAVELAKAKKEIQEKDAEIDREGKIAGVFCKAYEKAVLLDPTEENVRIWAKCTRMTRDEMEDTVKESRELAEVFRTIADLMERFLPDRGTL